MNQVIMANSTMAKKMKKSTQTSGKKFHCGHCDALCDDSYRVQTTELESVCMGRVPIATEQNTQRFCSTSCMKHYVFTKELDGLNRLLSCATESAKGTSEMFRFLKQRKERDLEREESVLIVWKASQAQVNLFQACLNREPVQRLILLQAKVLQYTGDVLEHFHDDSRMMDGVLKKIKVIQEMHLDLLGS